MLTAERHITELDEVERRPSYVPGLKQDTQTNVSKAVAMKFDPKQVADSHCSFNSESSAMSVSHI